MYLNSSFWFGIKYLGTSDIVLFNLYYPGPGTSVNAFCLGLYELDPKPNLGELLYGIKLSWLL